jgi:hypothetical protein
MTEWSRRVTVNLKAQHQTECLKYANDRFEYTFSL